MTLSSFSSPKKPLILYVKGPDSHESYIEERMLLSYPRQNGHGVLRRVIDPMLTWSGDTDDHGSLEEACDSAWRLYSGLGRGLAIVSYNPAAPIVNDIEVGVLVRLPVENHSDLMAINLGEHTLKSSLTSLQMGHKLVQLIQQTASQG